MKCYNHSEIDATATCTRCGKAICSSCAVDVSGRITCTECLSSGNVNRFQNQATRPSNTLAIISLVFGILGICSMVFAGGIFFSIPAWITGHIALNQIHDDPNQDGEQLAKTGKIMGMVITILYAIGVICYVGFIVIAMIGSASYSY